MSSTADLTQVVKAYDVRGLVGSQLTSEVVEALAAGFVDEIGAAGPSSSSATTCATRRRSSRRPSPAVRGPAGPTSSTSGSARPTRPTSPPATSGLPPRCSPRATTRRPTTASSSAARERRASPSEPGSPPSGTARTRTSTAAVHPGRRAPGSYEERDVLADYAGYLRSLVDLSDIRPLRIVVDAGNGMGGDGDRPCSARRPGCLPCRSS